MSGSSTRTGTDGWTAARFSVSLIDAQSIASSRGIGERFSFERPSCGLSHVGLGVARAVEARGAGRFSDCAKQARELFASLRIVGDAAPDAAGPLLLGGFGFDDEPGTAAHWSAFPPARLVLPDLLVSRIGENAWVTAVDRPDERESDRAFVRRMRERVNEEIASTDAGAASAPRRAATTDHHIVTDDVHDAYLERVGSVLRGIGAGELEKVVVARSIAIRRPGGFDPAVILASLRDTYPSCTAFSVQRGDATFLGATPELLVRVAGDRVETTALAGSAPRGRDPDEDARIGRALIESKKEQNEHAVVVRALRDALAPCCDELDVPESPRLLQVDGIQHLETPILGLLEATQSSIELAGRLHPTPSVGGAPNTAALEWLKREEGLERGWYAGAVGTLDAAGGGEFSVALRSALLLRDEARLFAGAGIVEGSDPAAEHQETRLKLWALLHPLLDI